MSAPSPDAAAFGLRASVGAGEARAPPPLLRAAYAAAAALVLAAFFAAALHGIGNVWQWGHNGYNGAAFSQAARNSLRFGIAGQAQYHTGLSPPRPEEIYTHHPMALHAHLVAAYALLGEREWVGRLVPAAYSVLALVMVFLLARRLRGGATALCAAALYALVPLNLIFANMINHEQGCIFWCLFMIHAYLRWREQRKPRDAALALLAATMAVQFDWPGYYFAFFVFAHAVACSTRGSGPVHRRPDIKAAAVLAALVLANAGGFFAFVAHARGGLSEMKAAFAFRSASPPGYFAQLWERGLQLHGEALLALLALWIPWAIWRALRGRGDTYDLLAAAFLAAQTVQSLVFKQAGWVHVYWTYYLGPAMAFAGADLLVAAAAWSGARLPERARGLPAAVLAVLAIAQARVSWDRLQWGFATGAASYVVPYDDQCAELAWAREVSRRYPREAVAYTIHPSVRNWRIEFAYYLDAPLASGTRPPPPEPGRRSVLLADLHHVLDPGEAQALAELARRSAAAIWDRRFVAIEVGAAGGAFAGIGYASRKEPAPWWWRWLVHPTRPPVSWVADPGAGGVFDTPPVPTREASVGGPGGTAVGWSCPRGEWMAGLAARFHGAGDRRVVQALRPACADPRGTARGGPWIGGGPLPGAAAADTVACPAGALPVGLFGRSGEILDAVGVLCSAEGTASRTSLLGGTGGAPFELRCPEGSALAGFRGRSGDLVDAAGIACAEVGRGGAP